MNKVKQIMVTFIVVLILVATSIPAFAATSNQLITLPRGNIFVEAGNGVRSGNYSYSLASCQSVYPESGTDTYTIVKCYIMKYDYTPISSTISITEGKGDARLSIYEGYLGIDRVFFMFSGDNYSTAASAVVSYNAN